MHRYHDPSRIAFAQNGDGGGGGNSAFVSLFNNSNQYHLAVLTFGNDPSSNTSFGVTRVDQGQVGTGGVAGQSLISGRGPMPGIVNAGEVATNPAANMAPNITAGAPGWNHEWPLIVLAPGWSLTGYAANAGQPLAASFWWAVLLPDELTNNKIGDPDIDF